MKPNIFTQVKVDAPTRNVFNLTHDVKMSGNMGNIMPLMVLECVPGDKIIIGCDSLIRFQPLIAPIMHRVDVTMHYFAVPNRLVWDGWENFITNTEEIPLPFITIDGTENAAQKKFLDYMGIPPNNSGSSVDINAMPFGAYQMIYDEYYRDENLIPEVDIVLLNGDNNLNKTELCTMRKRAWEHDYFTSCLPFAQKGAAVDIPLGDVALKDNWNTFGQQFLVDVAGVPLPGTNQVDQGPGPNLQITGIPGAIDPNGTLQVQATTIEDLRRAFRLQEWLEKNARGGTRYTEHIRMHFGVNSPDARMQRPEYIVGVKSPVVISEVLNQTGEDGGLPQGNMAGHGVSVGTGKLGSYYAFEHCFIIGVVSITPKTAYQQGIPKTYLRKDPLEYFWKDFAHIGEQEVTNNEVYAYEPDGDETFGYIPRYAEYKYMPSRVAGDMRTSLDFWHLGRIFATPPTLSQEFIECDPLDCSRIFAVTDPTQDTIVMYVLNKIKAIRPMPIFGTPYM